MSPTLDPPTAHALRFAETNRALLAAIMDQPAYRDGRSERVSRAAPGGVALVAMDCSAGTVSFNGLRRIRPRVAAAELAWTLQGTTSLAWLERHTRMWTDFADGIDQDGERFVSAAYGYRWRRHFGRDQLACLLDALVDDPTSKQQVVLAWDPSMDGLGHYHARNVPCPLGFQVTVIAGRLNVIVYQRASDAVIGLAYDSAMYGLLLHALVNSLRARGLQVRPGSLSMMLGHAHVYEPQFEIARHMASTEPTAVFVEPPAWSVEDIRGDPDGYVTRVREAARYMNQAPLTAWQHAVGGGQAFEAALATPP